MVIQVKKEDFKKEISEGIVLVDFFATWCGPCKMLGPVIEEIANDRIDIKFIKVDIDLHEDLAREYGIMSVPTLLLFKDGNLTKRNIGFLPKEILEEWIRSE